MSESDNLPAVIADQEIAQLENAMKDAGGEYYTGPKTPDGKKTVMESRYLELVKAKESGESTSNAGELDPEAQAEGVAYWQSPLGQEIIDYWQSHGGAVQNVKNGQALSDDFMTTIPPDDREAFTARVAALSWNTQARFLLELTKPYVQRNIEHASRERIALFSDTPAGAALVAEWGVNAPRKVAVVYERIARVFDRLNEKENTAASQFLDDLSEYEFGAVMAYLARAA